MAAAFNYQVNDPRSLGARRDQGAGRGCSLWLYMRECLLLAHHIGPGIDRHGLHQRVSGPFCDIGTMPALEA
jgi:hypothetical protein